MCYKRRKPVEILKDSGGLLLMAKRSETFDKEGLR